MEYRRLGSSSLELSAFSLGTWPSFGHRLTFEESKNLLAFASDRGVNFIDCAEAYCWGGAEHQLGRLLKDLKWSRDSYCISSKVYYGCQKGESRPTQKGLSKKHIYDGCNQALERLSLDYLDFYLCHSFDEFTNIEEVVWAMHCLVLQGKIIYWGTSKWPSDAVSKAIRFADEHSLVRPSVEQAEYNVLNSKTVEEGLVDLAEDGGIGIMAWSPLKQGILAGRYDQGIPPGSRFSFGDLTTLKSSTPKDTFQYWIQISKALQIIANELSVTRAQLCLAWCLKNRFVTTVLLGCSCISQLDECLNSLPLVTRMTNDVWLSIHDIHREIEI
jgi:voltage-dependent potassium channel beta subunit